MLVFSREDPVYRDRCRTALLSVFFTFLVIWLVFNAYTTVLTIVDYYNPLPEWDYWRIPINLQSYQSWDFRILWKQHNEHRIVFPELFFAADILFWHGHKYLPLLTCFSTYVGTWLVLCFALFSDKALSRKVQVTSSLLAGIMMLWTGSVCVLGDPFLLQWPLMQLAVACSLLFLSRASESRQAGYLAAAIVSGVVATYSSGNGMFIWPVLVAFGLILHLSKRQTVVLIASAAASVGLYFVGYQFSQQLNIRGILLHPLYTLGFLATYISMPFAAIKTPAFGLEIGGVTLVLVFLFLVWTVRAKRISTRPAVVLFGYYGFTLLTCLLTAAGRMDPDDRTFGAAKAQRYVTMPMAAWAAFILLSFWLASRSRASREITPVCALVIALLLFLGFPKLRTWLRGIGDFFASQQIAALSVEDGVRDPKFLRRLYIDPAAVTNLLLVLERDHLTIYHKSYPGWIGKPVQEFARVINERANGIMVATFPLHTGLEIVGWVDDFQLGRPYRRIVLTDDHGIIIGFGERFPAGVPGDLLGWKIPPSLAWAGFISQEKIGSPISAYVVDPRRRRLLPIEGSIQPSSIEVASPEDQGAPVPGFHWTGDRYWTPHTTRKGIDFGTAPQSLAFTTWSGSDSFTAHAVSSDFGAPANGCLIVPVLHGPSVGGLSVNLLDAKTGAVIASAPMQDYDMVWEFWRIKISPTIRALRIVVRDDGREWGQWVAAATPTACR